MPSAGRGRRDTQQGGGTSAAAPTGSRGWLVALALVAAVVVGGVVWQRRGAARSPAETEAPVAAAQIEPAIDPGARTPPPPPPPPPTRRDPQAAAARLERALATQRLYGQASLRGAVLELRSSFCAEAALVQTVDAARAELAAEGLTAVRCLEPHGAEVFARAL